MRGNQTIVRAIFSASVADGYAVQRQAHCTSFVRMLRQARATDQSLQEQLTSCPKFAKGCGLAALQILHSRYVLSLSLQSVAHDRN